MHPLNNHEVFEADSSQSRLPLTFLQNLQNRRTVGHSRPQIDVTRTEGERNDRGWECSIFFPWLWRLLDVPLRVRKSEKRLNREEKRPKNPNHGHLD
ncbi:hypothetical protein EVAR_4040_1 [Eumeta japonica]|uniref:Uncharacterized protein n=1 Tax=Eumeta variegata TaxID=151549 RepID=A0A4C1T6R6_EUMVA|nr:hypothetical protein EVAR_4040_1 [Eumeta japonica]